MAAVLEKCTLEKQRSVVRFLWAKELPAKDIQEETLVCLIKLSTVKLYPNFGMQFEENVQAYWLEEFCSITTMPCLIQLG
ncbi:hypothetical protein AVEN_221334-1 [Araneus ventricosus]|uniref:Uncharacterized protein n=1 Tax=Araneus ventricosus TaxID=182803 RepID=A0A4Y2AZU9_ARAVE|nr:hypothetical protein AVEN_221334-1 [Araneus ventricosus]